MKTRFKCNTAGCTQYISSGMSHYSQMEFGRDLCFKHQDKLKLKKGWPPKLVAYGQNRRKLLGIQ